jgi:predicted small secreted protein
LEQDCPLEEKMRKLVRVRTSAARALLTLAVLAGAATALGACNTARGFGEDMSAAGRALSNSSDRIMHGEDAQSGSSAPTGR